MILSERTLKLIELGSKITEGIHFYKGSKILIMNNMRTLMIDADVDETFPSSFSVHGLKAFVDVLKLMKDPRIEFYDDQILIWKGNQRVKIKTIEPLYDYVKEQKLLEMEKKDFSFYLFEHKLKLLKMFGELFKKYELRINSCKKTNKLFIEIDKAIKYGHELDAGGLNGDILQCVVGNAVDIDKPLLLEHRHRTFRGENSDKWKYVNFINLLPEQDYKVYVKKKTILTEGYCLFESWDSYLKFYVLMEPPKNWKVNDFEDNDFADEVERIYQLTKEREVETMTN